MGDTAGIYLVHVPATASGPLPVVLSLHGYSSTAEVQAQLTGLGPFGDQAGFVTITPQVTRTVPSWDISAGSPDVTFVGGVIDDVEATICVDSSRIYAAGMSNGAMMASRLACDLSPRIAAFAMVTGIIDPEACNPGHPVPVVAIHGTGDPFVAFEGGVGPGASLLPGEDGSTPLGSIAAQDIPPELRPPVADRVTAWVNRDGCNAAVTPQVISSDVTEFDYTCPAGAAVEFWRVEGGGHTWPGSPFLVPFAEVVGPTTMSISANEVIWSFFRQFTSAAHD